MVLTSLKRTSLHRPCKSSFPLTFLIGRPSFTVSLSPPANPTTPNSYPGVCCEEKPQALYSTHCPLDLLLAVEGTIVPISVPLVAPGRTGFPLGPGEQGPVFSQNTCVYLDS